MAIYKRSSRGLWLPGGQPTIDWTNPITAGLVGCWVATGEGGATPIIRDIISKNIAVRAGTSATIVPGPAGLQAQDNTVFQSGWIGTTASAQKGTNALSALWFGGLHGAGVSAGMLFGSIFGTGGSSPYDCITLRRSGSAQVQMFWNNGFQNSLTASNAFASTSAGIYSILGTVAAGGNAYIYGSGNLLSSGSAAAGSITYAGATDTIGIGMITGTNFSGGSGLSVGLLWNRQLAPGESALISADPTNFLLFPGDLIPNKSLVGAAAPGAALASAPAAASTATAALTTAIRMQAAPAASAVANAAMSTSIRLAAALASASTTTAALTTGVVLQAAAAGAATAGAALTTGIPLLAAPAAAAAVTAALTTAIPLLAAPAAVATVTGALTTAIPLLAAPVAVATITAALTAPGSVWAATAVAVATITAALTTGIVLTAAPAAVATVTAAFTTAIRLIASLFSVGTGSGTLSDAVGPATAISPHLAVRRRMIARKGRNITLRRGGLTFTDTAFRAFVHGFDPREFVEGLKQGDQHVETLSDVTPVVGDKLLIGGKMFNVLGANILYDGDTLLGYSLWVRG